MEHPYTRYPVYRGSLDDILGILHVRDLFRAAEQSGGIANVKIEPLVRPAHMVPETKDLAALLREFRRTKEHMAIVSDEYGAMEGIVTLEDLLEEIVGEIEDEFDLPDESVEHVEDGRIRIHGTFPIDDFNEQFTSTSPRRNQHDRRLRLRGELGHAARGDRSRRWASPFTVIEVEGTDQRLESVPAGGESRRPRRRRAGGRRAA